MTTLVPHGFFDVPWLRPAVFDEIEDVWSMGDLSAMQNGLALSEDEKNVYVEAALPGVKPEDIELTFDKGTLWIRAEHAEKEEDRNRKYYRRAQRSFSYRIMVPGDIDQKAEPQTEYENGRLLVTFTKLPQEEPKKIKVKASGKAGMSNKTEVKKRK